MAKTSGSYDTVVRGVSQQVPEQRLSGQHAEQINMVSDPVEGLSRRRGSVMALEVPLFTGESTASLADLRQLRLRDFSIGTTDYALLYRPAAKVATSSAASLYCYNKTANLNVPLVIAGGDAAITGMLEAGISAVGQVGRFLLLASSTLVTTGTTTEVFAALANSRAGAVWVRGGAYSRTFTVSIHLSGGTTTSVSYTTPASSYPGVLDTSGIAAADPEYQKKVNDIVNAYNGAATAWIGTAAAAIQPEAIAEQLRLLIVAAGLTGTGRVASTLSFANDNIVGITATDGGDSTLIRAAYQIVTEASQLVPIHFKGKVVKVQAKADAPAYYVKAVPRDPALASFGEVTWEETTSTSFTPGAWFALGTVDAGNLYVASSPALLQGLVPAIPVPTFSGRDVGDADTNKAPFFIGRTITYLGTFQDRLVVGSGAVLSISRTGDYFNFFRSSVLTVVDSDPAEVFALGSEDDVIRHGVIFDKSLLLFGEQQQYSISGRVPLTPKTTSVIQSSAHENATDAAPLTSGDLVFYFKQREGATQAYQIAIGDVEDTSKSSEITQQLSDYIPSAPVEAVATTSPHMIILRTSGARSNLYVYRYLDGADRTRLLDSWSTWKYDPLLGDIVGLSEHDGSLLLFHARHGLDANGDTRTWLVIDRQSMLPRIPATPHLDSQRKYDAVVAGALTRPWHAGSPLATAYDATVPVKFLGESLLADVPSMVAEFSAHGTAPLWSGLPFESSVSLTNPFKRDRNNVAIVAGRLTVTRVDVSYSNTAGLIGTVTTAYASEVALDFNGRVLGAANNTLDTQPVSKGSVPVFIGREVREYSLTIAAKRWLPLTITGIEWTGQFFLNHKRS